MHLILFKRIKNVHSLIIRTAVYLAATAIISPADVIYVSPSGSSGASGTSFSNAVDYATGLDRAGSGDTLLMQEGTYTIPQSSSEKNTISLSKSGSSGKSISVIAYNDSRAIFDFGWPNNSKVINSSVTSYGFYITGNYWYFRGICITRAGYQGAYVTGSNITFENCEFFDNWNSGLEINKGGSKVLVVNCDSYRNFDGAYKNGGMADGFAPKQEQGSGNRFVGCRAWENSDDGYDTYDSPDAVIFEDCWAFRNGVNIWDFNGFEGNGNGFKVGGNGKLQNNKLTRCIVFGQPQKGFDQNGNVGGLTIYNSLAYSNGTNFALGGDLSSGEKHTLINNISLSGTNTINNANEENNTWNSPLSVSTADFESLDTTFATVQRSADGTLPEIKLFRLKSTSDLVDAGVDIGQPFNGKAPDLGPFETYSTGIGFQKAGDPVQYSLQCSYNAVRRTITVEFSLVNPGVVSITVYDISGKIIVRAVQFTGVKGVNRKLLAAGHLPHGVSIIHVQKPEGLLCIKLIR